MNGNKTQVLPSLPTLVKIGNMDYRIVPRDREWKTNTESYGSCHDETLTINIVTHVPLAIILDTLVHEIMHAMIFVYHVPIDSDGEEKLVTSMSSALLGVLRDNPALLDYINKSITLINKGTTNNG